LQFHDLLLDPSLYLGLQSLRVVDSTVPRYQLIDVDHSHTTPMLNRESTRVSHGCITSLATIGGN
jgi:hypothetical protein